MDIHPTLIFLEKYYKEHFMKISVLMLLCAFSASTYGMAPSQEPKKNGLSLKNDHLREVAQGWFETWQIVEGQVEGILIKMHDHYRKAPDKAFSEGWAQIKGDVDSVWSKYAKSEFEKMIPEDREKFLIETCQKLRAFVKRTELAREGAKIHYGRAASKYDQPQNQNLLRRSN